MKWSEFKKIVDDRIGDTDPEILYIDVDDSDSLDVVHNPLGLSITEPLCDHVPLLTNREIDYNGK